MTTKEAEVTKTQAALSTAWKSYQDALAARAEEIKAGELPEVWQADDRHAYHYKQGEALAHNYYSLSEKDEREYKSGRGDGKDLGVKDITEARFNELIMPLYGADFTGRLDQIDVPVCELNQATRDEIVTKLAERKSVAFECTCPEGWLECISTSLAHMLQMGREGVIYRLRAPKTRPMARKEVLAWAASADAFGWVVRHVDTIYPMPPQGCYYYENELRAFTRARIATLNDDGTGGTWEAFEVPAK